MTRSLHQPRHSQQLRPARFRCRDQAAGHAGPAQPWQSWQLDHRRADRGADSPPTGIAARGDRKQAENSTGTVRDPIGSGVESAAVAIRSEIPAVGPAESGDRRAILMYCNPDQVRSTTVPGQCAQQSGSPTRIDNAAGLLQRYHSRFCPSRPDRSWRPCGNANGACCERRTLGTLIPLHSDVRPTTRRTSRSWLNKPWTGLRR